VLGKGNPKADIMLVGEAPGMTEAYTGQPFVGNSGKCLDNILELAGLKRSDIYITNVCKCWPCEGEVKKDDTPTLLWGEETNSSPKQSGYTNRKPTPKEMKACFKYLSEEIDLVKPKVIIPLGSTALNALEVKKQKITDRVGLPSLYPHSNFHTNRIYMIPTYHPSYVLRNGGVNTKFGLSVIAKEVVSHIKKAVDLSNDNILFIEHQYRVVDNREKLEKVLSLIKERKVMTFDVETSGVNWKDYVLGLGIGLDEGVSCYIPFFVKPLMSTNLVPFWDDKDISRETVIDLIRPILEDKHIKKSAHNSHFDTVMIRKDLKIKVNGLSWDSMCSAYLINENTSNALDVLKNNYIDLLGYSERWKKETNSGSNSTNASLQTISDYCCGDCDATYRLTKDHYNKFLSDPERMKFMTNFYVPLMEFCEDFEYYGVKYNRLLAEKMITEYTERSKKIEKDIYQHANIKFNVASAPEVAKVLFKHLGLTSNKNTDTGKVSTDNEVLGELGNKHIVPKLILDHRHLKKMSSTYLENPLRNIDKNDRVHMSIRPVGTKTGRPSSKGLMNIPRESDIKKMYIAEEGNYLIQSDLSQAEVRCFAHYANDKTLKSAFDSDEIDVHSLVASEVNNIPYDTFIHKLNILEDPIVKGMRQAAKGTVFGLLYGRGAKSIAMEYNIPIKEAEDFMNAFFGRFPNCKKWILDTHEYVKKQGYVKNIFGRTRYLPGIFSFDSDIKAKSERQSVNSIIQSTASDITILALIRIHKHLKENNIPGKIVLTVYDSIITETRNDYVDYVSNLMVDTMECSPHKDFSVKMKADIDIYKEWGIK
jgi:DNA polymerase-1